jgi:hypothetical protein
MFNGLGFSFYKEYSFFQNTRQKGFILLSEKKQSRLKIIG